MDDPRETTPASSSVGSTPNALAVQVDDPEAMIAWYLSDEFDEHLDRCFGEAKREAIDERDRVLREHQKAAARETNP